jgi:hypothetical protein
MMDSKNLRSRVDPEAANRMSGSAVTNRILSPTTTKSAANRNGGQTDDDLRGGQLRSETMATKRGRPES